MGGLLSKLIVGSENLVNEALEAWKLVAPDCSSQSIILSEQALECDDYSAVAPFLGKDITVYLALDDTKLNRTRQVAFDYLQKAGFSMPPLIHPQSMVDPRIKPGQNWTIGQGALIERDVTCGVNLMLNANAAIYHNCQIGSHVAITENAHISPNCCIGDCVTIGANVILRQDCRVGEQSRITKPGYYSGRYPSGTFITDEFSASILV